MVAQNSPTQRLSELFIISQLASLKRGQEVAQGTRERQLILSGQHLEVTRQILAKVDAMHKPTAPLSGPAILRQIKEVLSFLAAVHKAWPVIRWAFYINTFGWLVKHAARLLGWL